MAASDNLDGETPRAETGGDPVRRPYKLVLFYGVLAFCVVCLPLLLSLLGPSFIASTYGPEHAIFELFGLSAALGLAIIARIEFGKLKGAPNERKTPLFAGLLVAFFLLIDLVEHTRKSNDYEVYELAASAVAEGRSPYEDPRFLYPPLPPRAMAALFGAIRSVASDARLTGDLDKFGWDCVFYFYTCCQFALACAAYVLLYRFGRSLRMDRATASVLAAILMVVNNPMIRTLRHNQVNLLLLDSVLVALVVLPKHPIAAGAALSMGGHVKIYPYALALPLLITRRWKALAATVAFSVALLVIAADFGRDVAIWERFITFFLTSFPARSNLLRDNSVTTILYHTIRFTPFAFGLDSERIMAVAGPIAFLVKIAFVAWIVQRGISRERILREIPSGKPDHLDRDRLRFAGHALDIMALTLLTAPVVWEHHYILAMPIVVFAWAMFGDGVSEPDTATGRARAMTILAAFLIFAVPTFDVHLLSYHRIAGLIMLLWLCSPARIGSRNGKMVNAAQP
ncbi:MAG TPA: glycosyltransferase family 87 protein [Candidatus Brocadiia bacterium]|nr:glycosyltransferase family 87 protein [Candidatus Brocadiia bacterium]